LALRQGHELYVVDVLAIYNMTKGQPFLTQAVAFELVQYLSQQHRREATVSDVEDAASHALESGGEYFSNLWNDAGDGGRAILGALVAGETVPTSPKARRRLKEQDVLNGAGKFAVPKVERWVRERIPPGEV